MAPAASEVKFDKVGFAASETNRETTPSATSEQNITIKVVRWRFIFHYLRCVEAELCPIVSRARQFANRFPAATFLAKASVFDGSRCIVGEILGSIAPRSSNPTLNHRIHRFIEESSG
jgi:hypothetical protein